LVSHFPSGLQPIPLVLEFLFGLQPVLLTLALPTTLLDVNPMRMPGNVFMRKHGGNDRLRMRGIPHLLSGVHLLASRLIVVLVHRGIFLSESEHRLSNTHGCPWLSDRAAAPHGVVPPASRFFRAPGISFKSGPAGFSAAAFRGFAPNTAMSSSVSTLARETLIE